MYFIYGYSHMYFGKKIAFSIHFALTFEKLMPGWRFLRSLFLLLHVNKENWFPGCAPLFSFFDVSLCYCLIGQNFFRDSDDEQPEIS